MAGSLTTSSGKSTINLSRKKFVLVVAEWNEDVTEALFDSAQ
jgi:6,7-dimethyl-8-ribityllumazine synthase